MVILVRTPTQGGLDPVIQVGSSAQKFVEPLYEGLVFYDSTAKTYKPALAESWSISKDGLQYAFKLRRGVKFHDGTEFNAQAVRVNYERTKAINQGLAYLLASYARVEVVDPYTVRILLREPTPYFLYTTFKIKMVSPAAIQAHDAKGDLAQEWLKTNEAGTGPFQLVKWEPETENIFKRFPQYWAGWKGKHLETISYRRIAEPATQRQLLERGDADMIIDQVLPQDVPALQRNADIRVDIWSAALIMLLTMRSDRGVLTSRRLREALTYAFPYEDVYKALGGLAGPAQGPLPKALPEHDDSLPIYKQDLNRARRLLAEAGYPNGGLTFTASMVEALAIERISAELYQTALAQLNIRLNIQELVWPVLVAKFRNENEAGDMSFLVMDSAGPAPDKILIEAFYSGSRGKVFNWGWYKNALLDKVLEQAAVTVDGTRRTELYRRAQRIIVGDAPAIFVMEPAQVYARRAWVQGFKPDLISPFRLNLEDMYIEGRGR
jgi:peptide/nickel transport system substrate-binding protein